MTGAGAGADSAGQPWAGRSLRASPFAGDTGEADPGLARAVAAWAAGQGSLADVVAALAPARLLVPVLAGVEPVARASDAAPDDAHREARGADRPDPRGDDGAHAAVVAVATPDGRQGLPVFTSVASLAEWRADARPVPVLAPRAALSCVQEGWSVLVVDPAGPVAVAVPRPAVWALARGEAWRPAVVGGVVDGEVADAVRGALGGLAAVREVGVEPGRRAEVCVVLGLAPGLDRAGLDAALAAAGEALGRDGVVAARVDGLELRVRAAR